MQIGRSVIWKRLDGAGMDACRYLPRTQGWHIEGTAVFAGDGVPSNLFYRFSCSRDWTSLNARVRGWIGSRDVSLDLARDLEGVWTANGEPVDAVAGLLDIDLGFTPASNTNAIRRLDPPTDSDVETTAVWLDPADWTIKPLKQTYRRQSASAFVYASPTHGYRAVLDVDDFGIVTKYPGLWEAVSIIPDRG